MRHVRGALVEGEVAKGTSSTGMDNSFGDTLMVESVDLGNQLSPVNTKRPHA